MTLTKEVITRSMTGIFLVLIFAVIVFLCPSWILSITFAGLGLLAFIIEVPPLNLGWYSLLYPTIPFLLLIALNESSTHHLAPVLLVLIGSYDTGAFIIGKLIGTHQLSSISPKKTWEGVGGGLICAYGATAFLLHVYGIAFSWYMLLSLCSALVMCGTFGDLFESWLKRRVGKKESGALLPGHGGILDRFDGILGAAPLMYLLRHTFFRLLAL